MKILVRDFDNDKWKVARFNQHNRCIVFPYKANNINYIQAMCYDADYLGTTKKPPNKLILKSIERNKELIRQLERAETEVNKIRKQLNL